MENSSRLGADAMGGAILRKGSTRRRDAMADDARVRDAFWVPISKDRRVIRETGATAATAGRQRDGMGGGGTPMNVTSTT